MQTFREKIKSSRKLRIRLILIAAAAAALFAASFYTLVIKPSQSGDRYIYKEASVTKGNLVKGIMESGTVSLSTSSVIMTLISTRQKQTKRKVRQTKQMTVHPHIICR